VLLTDAPASEYLLQAQIDLGAIELIGGAGGPQLLSDDGTDGLVDLLELRNGATTSMALASVPAGRYQQLRLIVERASVTLADGYLFGNNTTTMDLTVPSGAQTGLRLNLKGVVDGSGGGGGGAFLVPGPTVLVLDFDVERSFALQGSADDPAGFSGAILTPRLRLSDAAASGTISGRVTTPVSGASVQGLVVTATPVEGLDLEPFQTHDATAITSGDGSFSMSFLVPGEYVVSVEGGEGRSAASIRVSVPRSGTASGTLVLLEAGGEGG